MACLAIRICRDWCLLKELSCRWMALRSIHSWPDKKATNTAMARKRNRDVCLSLPPLLGSTSFKVSLKKLRPDMATSLVLLWYREYHGFPEILV